MCKIPHRLSSTTTLQLKHGYAKGRESCESAVLGMSTTGNHITDKRDAPISAEYDLREFSLNHLESFHIYTVTSAMNITC
jgi:hypothetical protein